MKTTPQILAILRSPLLSVGPPPFTARAGGFSWWPGLLAGALLAFHPLTSRAADGSWNITGNNGNWATGSNWTNNQVADGTDFTAYFINNITLDRTVVVDAGRTIGNLVITDPTGSQNRTFTGGPLILSTTSLKPQIRVSAGALVTTFNVEIQGTSGLRKEQANTVLLNSSNSWTGDTDINRGTLRLGNVNAIPNGPGRGNVNLQIVSGNPVLDIGSVNPTINGLNSTSILATVNSSSGTAGLSTLTVGAGDANGEFGGVIANGTTRTVGLTKTGAGTQSLTNINTYSGPTTINGGSLRLLGDGSIANSSAINLAGGATFDVAGVTATPYTVTAGQTLSGPGGTGTIQGSVTLNSSALLSFTHTAGTPNLNVASGTLTLDANATSVTAAGAPLADGSYKLIAKSGAGSVAGTTGTLAIGGLGVIGGGTPALAISGGELFLNISGGAPVLEWGSGDGTWAVGTAGWNSGGGTAFANGNAALLSDSFSTGNPTLTLNTEVLPQSLFVNSTNHYTISGSGNIGGAAEIRKLGTGALTLDAANTCTGGAYLFEGTINLKNAAALGAASGAFTINAGTIDNTTGGALTLNNHPQVWNGDFTFTGSSDLNLGTGDVTLGSTRTIAVNANTLTVSGNLTGTGGLVKNGAGTLNLAGSHGTSSGGVTVNAGLVRLGGNNTFPGGVVINDGEVLLENDGALNSGAPVSVTFQTDTDPKYLTLNGHSVTVRNLAMGIIAGGGVTTVRNNHASTAVTLTVDANATSQFAGTIADGAAASLSLTKTGSSNWTLGGGGVGGGTYSGDTVISTGTLTAGANNAIPSGPGKGNLNVASGATFDILDRSAMSLNGLWGAGIVNRSNPGGAPVCTLTLGNNDASATFSGRLRTTGASATLNVTKTGTGTQILSGANDYTGTTTIDGGILQIGEGAASGSLTSASIVNNAVLVYNRGGNMTYGGVISGPGHLTNSGPGVVSLTGANTYQGTTTINAGTLRVNSPGSLDAASTVTINSGGTLGGTGTINGPVTVAAGGTLAPGASVGTLTINNTVSLGGTTVMELSRDSGVAESDLLTTGGLPLTYGGGLVVTNIGITSLRPGDSFNLFDASSFTPGFAPVNLPPLLPGLSWANNLGTDGTLSITGTIIPPTFSPPVVNGGSVTFNGSGGVAFGAYYVLTSTEVGDPIANWTPISTNTFDASGNFTFSDTDPSAPQRFYMIAIP